MTTIMPQHYRVAAIQFEPVLGATAENRARLLDLTQTAARNGARLIVLPELATTGACWYNRDEIRPHVEPIPGPTTEAFTQVALQYDCFMVVGMAEVAPHTGIFYNSAALIGPAGVVGVYRKTHPFAGDTKWAKAGDLGLPVWETPLGRIGILICMDSGYFEPARLLALAGADVFCFPTNWLGEKSPGPAWSTRAWENGCYLIAADRYGIERGIQFSGGSCVLTPDGTIQAMQDTGDGIVYGDVSLAAARQKSFRSNGRSEKLVARRPELYDNLTLNGYMWEPLEFHGLYDYKPLPAARKTNVAVVQFTPQSGDPQTNVTLIERTLVELCTANQRTERAHSGSVELVVFPEYAVTGCPDVEHQDVALVADEIVALHETLVELARRYALYLLAGYAEHSSGHIFSTAVLIGPEGVRAHYHKTHVVGDETGWCRAGDNKPPVVDLPLGRVGVLLGTDLCFPEMARCLAIAGCDLLAVPAGPGVPSSFALGPTAIRLPPPAVVDHHPHHFHLARQRAIENNCYIALASLPYPNGVGASGVFGPAPVYRVSETILDRYQSGSVVRIVDTTNLDTVYPALAPVRTKELVRTRQPHLYDSLQNLTAIDVINGGVHAFEDMGN